MLDRFADISASQEDLESEELREDAAETAGCTRINDCRDRQIVTVTGTLRTVTLRPRAGVPALEAELFDGSAALDVVWLGRRSIVGIEPGRKLIASGRVSLSHGRRVLFNPKYELRPLGRE
ncbi:nucleic acid binding, OB-fold, tRNA/helicase-type [Streptomyces albus]|uniref:Nucleic acid binding, OB-fold, tRNA/helicase-type n=2 Tax=Streptomyces TaxID=1883 RepID=A0A0B5EUI4_STRA4|nr:nucleic acid binding, OB-fold, tRNA/helicase-type [Streptomyces albus]AOU76084.1 nucleic acid binding, OB-fold, tRNA/helicase-type [Streptomyces albus]AYN31877.1 nucleic acid binding, OB-fold, tRNA/helicase-type [Streptomyces albus]